jgi:hypothetical protein
MRRLADRPECDLIGRGYVPPRLHPTPRGPVSEEAGRVAPVPSRHGLAAGVRLRRGECLNASGHQAASRSWVAAGARGPTQQICLRRDCHILARWQSNERRLHCHFGPLISSRPAKCRRRASGSGYLRSAATSRASKTPTRRRPAFRNLAGSKDRSSIKIS